MKLLIALAVAQALDAGTSCVAFAQGLREANPFIPSNCAVATGAKAGAVTVAWAATRGHPRARRVIYWLGIGAAGTAAAWNTRALSRTR